MQNDLIKPQRIHIEICCPLRSLPHLWSSLIFALYLKTVTGFINLKNKQSSLSSLSNHSSIQAEAEMLAVSQVSNYTKKAFSLNSCWIKIFEIANPTVYLAKTALVMHSGERGVSVDLPQWVRPVHRTMALKLKKASQCRQCSASDGRHIRNQAASCKLVFSKSSLDYEHDPVGLNCKNWKRKNKTLLYHHLKCKCLNLDKCKHQNERFKLNA